MLEFRQRSANKHEFYKNTAGLRSGNSSDSDSACLKVVSYVKVFELRGTVNESERYWATTNGLFLRRREMEFALAHRRLSVQRLTQNAIDSNVIRFLDCLI